MHDRRICLIGGSGFIGSYIAERLAEQEASLTITTRNRDRHKAALIVLPKTELVSTNVHHPLALQEVLSGHDTVISMVGILHGSRKAFERAHVELLDKIIATCHQQGIRRLLHISAPTTMPCCRWKSWVTPCPPPPTKQRRPRLTSAP